MADGSVLEREAEVGGDLTLLNRLEGPAGGLPVPVTVLPPAPLLSLLDTAVFGADVDVNDACPDCC